VPHSPHVIKIYSLTRQRPWPDGTPWPSVSIHTNIGYTHYLVARGLAGFISQMGWLYVHYYPKTKDKAPVDKWMEG